jgi:hypothetical protein
MIDRFSVMAGFMPAIHAFHAATQDVDGTGARACPSSVVLNAASPAMTENTVSHNCCKSGQPDSQ